MAVGYFFGPVFDPFLGHLISILPGFDLDFGRANSRGAVGDDGIRARKSQVEGYKQGRLSAAQAIGIAGYKQGRLFAGPEAWTIESFSRFKSRAAGAANVA